MTELRDEHPRGGWIAVLFVSALTPIVAIGYFLITWRTS